MLRDILNFYFILLLELLFWPIQFISHWCKVLLDSDKERTKRKRKAVCDHRILVNIHEWGGYGPIRNKCIKNGAAFECGLQSQLQRFSSMHNIDLTVTISDSHLHSDLSMITAAGAEIMKVDNKGFDFSGYASFYEKIKTGPNRYVILTNTSVNSDINPFLDKYVDYLEQHKDVGMLGISYCTKKIQSLIRPNFTPHLQSFFLLTTTQVLNEVVTLNNGKFPGNGIMHKLLLIRQGEIRLSKLVEKLGYRLAVVNPVDSKPYKFEGYHKWKLPFGDIRQKINLPNRITPITHD